MWSCSVCGGLTQLVAGIHDTYRGYTARGEECPARARWRLLGHSWSLRPVESWPAQNTETWSITVHNSQRTCRRWLTILVSEWRWRVYNSRYDIHHTFIHTSAFFENLWTHYTAQHLNLVQVLIVNKLRLVSNINGEHCFMNKTAKLKWAQHNIRISFWGRQ